MNNKTTFLLIILIFISLRANTQTVEPPLVTLVSVEPITQKVIINWTHRDTQNIDGYIIKRYVYDFLGASPGYHTIKEIPNNTTNSYTDTSMEYGGSHPTEIAEKYRVIAYKYVDNIKILSLMSNMHKTVHVEQKYDYCSNTNKITWNKYSGKPVEKYKLYVKTESSPLLLLSENQPDDTTFLHINIFKNKSYSYFVEAVLNNQISSLSNTNINFTTTPVLPSFVNTDSVAVNGSNLKLVFDIDETSDIKNYKILKSEKKITFDTIANFTDYSSDLVKFSDTNFDPFKKYYYLLVGYDYCPAEIIVSDTVSNLIIKQKQTGNNLENSFLIESLNFNFDYEVYRKFNNSEFNLYQKSNDNPFADDISDFYEQEFTNETTEGIFQYYLKYFDLNKKTHYISNVLTIKQQEKIYLPTGFNPKSNIEQNRIFKPKIAFVKDYILTIYSRWGNIIFETTNPNNGWDGKLPNNSLAPVASYLYYLSFKNSSGNIITKKGYVSLIY